MIYITLILAFLGTLSSGAMLSMLLLLVTTYVTASLWLIYNQIIYTGLLYILVYVGAIVVLIMFVVQLTNTNLIGENNQISTSLLFIQNSVLVICLTLLIIQIYYTLNSDWLINLSYLNLTETIINPTQKITSSCLNYLNSNVNNSNLSILAYSIFNEYSYILVISVHAIILAIIGPIKLAISST